MKGIVLLAACMTLPHGLHFVLHSLQLVAAFPVETQNPFTGEIRPVKMPMEDVLYMLEDDDEIQPQKPEQPAQPWLGDDGAKSS